MNITKTLIDENFSDNSLFKTSIEALNLLSGVYRRIESNGSPNWQYYKHYDENARLVYEGDYWIENEYWKYDENGNCIYHYISDGTSCPQESYYKYDEHNRLLYNKHSTKNHNTTIEVYKYDDKGNIIYNYKSNDSNDCYYENIHYWYDYDNNGNKIYYKVKGKSGGILFNYEEWWKYDNNNLIYYKYKDSKGEKEEFWTYDGNNNLTYHKDPEGKEQFWEYNEYDLIYHKDPEGKEHFWTYDANNNLTYHKDPEGVEEFWTYDGNKSICQFVDGTKDIHTAHGIYREQEDGTTTWRVAIKDVEIQLNNKPNKPKAYCYRLYDEIYYDKFMVYFMGGRFNVPVRQFTINNTEFFREPKNDRYDKYQTYEEVIDKNGNTNYYINGLLSKQIIKNDTLKIIYYDCDYFLQTGIMSARLLGEGSYKQEIVSMKFK